MTPTELDELLALHADRSPLVKLSDKVHEALRTTINLNDDFLQDLTPVAAARVGFAAGIVAELAAELAAAAHANA